MVSKSEIEDQLQRIGFNHRGWGKAEVSELEQIILEGEEIYECANGTYEGGFALLVATNIRVILVDKKPLNYLTVEDMRFDMISEIDYNHRLVGAEIGIASGDKHLRFRSFNQIRLRKLIGHVQHCMAETKVKQDSHQEGQIQHLEQINKQLEAYLMAQQQYQAQVQSIPAPTAQASNDDTTQQIVPPKPDNRLADYLYAKSLMEQHLKNQVSDYGAVKELIAQEPEAKTGYTSESDQERDDIYFEGMREVFGGSTNDVSDVNNNFVGAEQTDNSVTMTIPGSSNDVELNAMQIAYSKLPTVLRSRRFGRRAFSHYSDKPVTSASRA